MRQRFNLTNEDIMTGLMAGKRGLIMGLANDKSLAWGIAKRLHAEGAELAFSYQGEVMEKRVRPLAAQLGCDFLIDCDVADMANLDRAFETLADTWPTIDFVVHAIGFTNKEALRGKYYEVGLEDFLMTMSASVRCVVAFRPWSRFGLPSIVQVSHFDDATQ
jgi:enoyl-[acyl-carrier protein] reductase I